MRAIQAYARAIEIKPDDAQAYFGLGIGLRTDQGRKAAALRCHETLRRLDPQLAERLLNAYPVVSNLFEIVQYGP